MEHRQQSSDDRSPILMRNHTARNAFDRIKLLQYICKIGMENNDLFREKDARFDIEGNKCGNFSDFS